MIVPTRSVGMNPLTLRVTGRGASGSGVPTRSVGTIKFLEQSTLWEVRTHVRASTRILWETSEVTRAAKAVCQSLQR
jgi:hypothetical protein